MSSEPTSMISAYERRCELLRSELRHYSNLAPLVPLVDEIAAFCVVNSVPWGSASLAFTDMEVETSCGRRAATRELAEEFLGRRIPVLPGVSWWDALKKMRRVSRGELAVRGGGSSKIDRVEPLRRAFERGAFVMPAGFTFGVSDRADPVVWAISAGFKTDEVARVVAALAAACLRKSHRAEIDRVLAEDARAEPAFAVARRAAVLAAAEASELARAPLTRGLALDLLRICRSYEHLRGGGTRPAPQAQAFAAIWPPLRKDGPTVCDVYERSRRA